MSLIEQNYYTLLAHVHGRKCRAAGASDGHVARVFEAVNELGHGLHGKASKQIRLAFYEKFQSYGIDPATIFLLVQLALLIYKALQAAGYFDSAKGLRGVADARAIIGEL